MWPAYPENPRGYGTARAPVEKSDHARYSAAPVSDYWQALGRLFIHLDRTGEYYDTGPLPFCVQFVADLFWIHPNTVRADLIRFRKAQVQ